MSLLAQTAAPASLTGAEYVYGMLLAGAIIAIVAGVYWTLVKVR